MASTNGTDLGASRMSPRVDAIRFDDSMKRQPLVRAPLAARLHSGKVILSPGESVGAHSTADHEEILVILKGSGVAHADGKEDLEVSSGMMVYFPPDTRHDMTASKAEGMEYVYIVTKTA